jgi:hypothetical protein
MMHKWILEEALLIPTNNRNRRFEKNKKDPKRWSYDSENSAMLAQTCSKICAFCKVGGHVIIECPLINSEVKDGFVRYVG